MVNTQEHNQPVAWLNLHKMSPDSMVYATGFKVSDMQSPLFTHPANTAEIEQRVAEACAKYVHATKGAVGSSNMAEALCSGKWREYQ